MKSDRSSSETRMFVMQNHDKRKYRESIDEQVENDGPIPVGQGIEQPRDEVGGRIS